MATTNIDIKLAQIEQLDAKELTEGKVSGTGVFDVLMAAANKPMTERAPRNSGRSVISVLAQKIGAATFPYLAAPAKPIKIAGKMIKIEKKASDVAICRSFLSSPMANSLVVS